MANPLKVLTHLSASKAAQFAEVVEMQDTLTVSGGDVYVQSGQISGSGALNVGGAASLASTLTVSGNSALSGTLGVVGVLSLQDALNVSGVASFASDVSASAGLDVVGAAHVGGAFDMDSTLNVDGAASFQSSISGAASLDIGGAAHIAGAAQLDSTLDVDGAVDFDSTLNVAGVATFQSAISGAAGLDIDGNADISGSLAVHSNAVIYGNLEVKGVTTTIESTTVTVADANIQLATVASPTDTTADGAGITILGASNKTFQWNNDSHGFTSSENMNLAAGKVYKIEGQELLAKDGSKAKLSYNGGSANVTVETNRVDAIFDGSAGGQIVLSDSNDGDNALRISSASSILSSTTQVRMTADGDTKYVDITSAGVSIAGVASFQNDITASAAMDVAGAVNLQNTLAVGGVASFASDVTASAGMDLAGALHVVGAADFDSTLNVDGATTMNDMLTVNSNVSASGELQVGDLAIFGSWVAVDGDLIANSKLKISGSSEFINIGPLLVGGKYEVDEAIHALDLKAGQQASNINSNYNALRYLSSANFDAQGMASFTSSFAAADIEQVSVDVLVQAGGSGPWTNDLLSVQVKPAGSYVGFEISAPAMGASDKVRIIAVKESGSLA